MVGDGQRVVDPINDGGAGRCENIVSIGRAETRVWFIQKSLVNCLLDSPGEGAHSA